MHRLSLIFGMIAILLLSNGSACRAQERNFAPYFGASGSIDTNGNPGWGVEGGIRFFNFYAGLEYGMYGRRPQVAEIDPTPGSVPAPYPTSGSQFWGLHAGYVLPDSLFIGIVVLKSYQPWNSWDSISGVTTTTRSYLEFGPDLRYSGFDRGHIYLSLALTFRRGVKLGLGYMF